MTPKIFGSGLFCDLQTDAIASKSLTPTRWLLLAYNFCLVTSRYDPSPLQSLHWKQDMLTIFSENIPVSVIKIAILSLIMVPVEINLYQFQIIILWYKTLIGTFEKHGVFSFFRFRKLFHEIYGVFFLGRSC